MITKVHISDNENTPIGYLDELDVFKNGAEFDFIPGTNVIVGPNGSGVKPSLTTFSETVI